MKTSGRRRRLSFLGVAAVGAACAVALVLVVTQRGGNGPVAPVRVENGIEARGSITPRIALFGDTIEAVVEVALDRSRLDPESVRVAGRFAPWQVVGRPERVRRDAGETTLIRTTFVLRCLTGPCVPTGQSAPLEFNSARVAYSRTSGKRGTLAVDWPLLVVYSRFSAVRFDDAERASPWRADLVSLPAVSYRVPPAFLIGLLAAASALAAGLGVALATVAWPRRAPAPEPEPEPEPEPQPSLTPLEQALALLEESARADGASEQRRALELVAEELEEWGDDDLAGAARVLAWSEGVPAIEQTTALAARVRAELEQALLERAELAQNGDGGAA